MRNTIEQRTISCESSRSYDGDTLRVSDHRYPRANLCPDKKQRVVVFRRTSQSGDKNSFNLWRCRYTELVECAKLHTQWMLLGFYTQQECIDRNDVHCLGDFVQMILDCKSGKTDLVIMSGISSSFRSSVQGFAIVRELQRFTSPAAIYFDHEQVNTYQEDADFLIGAIL
jgi:hypothetical protein